MQSSQCSTVVVQAAKGKAIDNLLCQLEEQQLLLRPTEDLEGLNGSWQLLYTSLTIKVSCLAYTVNLFVNVCSSTAALVFWLICMCRAFRRPNWDCESLLLLVTFTRL